MLQDRLLDKCTGPSTAGVLRGDFSHRLYVQSGDADFRGNLLAALQNHTDYPEYIDVLTAEEIALIERDSPEYDHMRLHWFSSDENGLPFSPWFPNEKNLELKLRDSMIDFINWANQVDPDGTKRLDSCWIIHPPVELVTLYRGENEQTLTLYRITPVPDKSMARRS